MHCCQNAMDLLSSDIWIFIYVSDTIYEMEEFD
jgi:hypothetical protein